MSGDLSVTALYTCGVWAWAELPGADLLDHKDARRVLGATSAALAVAARGAPSLRHGLVQRHLMIDHLVADSGARHVLELGAGLSPRGVALSEQPNVTVTEVDRAPVLARKRALLERTPAGRAALARKNLRLVDGDLDTLDLAALDVAPPGALLCVIAEGLLVYLDAAAQASLFARVAALLKGRGGAFVFDLVPPAEQPPPGAAGRALGWMMRRFTKGADFARAPRTRDDIRKDLAAAGLDAAVLAPADAPPEWRIPHLDRSTQQLIWCCT